MRANSPRPQPPLQLLSPIAAEAQLRAVFEADGVVAAGGAQERVDAVEADDRRSVDSEEDVGIELLFKGLHALADCERALADVQLGVGTAGADVVDFRDGDDAELAAR